MLGLGGRRTHDATAVVTGAGSGIGQAFALALSDRGGNILCSDIDLASAETTVEMVHRRGGKATAVACDVGELDQVAMLADEARSWFGGIPSLVINNAGIGAGGTRVGATPIEDWEFTLRVNLWGPINGCHVFTPLLRAAGRGGIINVASAASFGAAPNMAPYNVSKAGVVSLSETLAAELAGSGVHVSVLCPTFVKTNILSSERITKQSGDLADVLMRVAGMSPDRVARTCLDAHDRGALYCLPQVDAKVLWRMKRHTPNAYARVAGLAGRIGPLRADDH